MVGQLAKALYGTRDTPQTWAEELGARLSKMNFVANPMFSGVFFHPDWRVAMVAHVDDTLFFGAPEALGKVKQTFEKKHEVKGRIMNKHGDEIKR